MREECILNANCDRHSWRVLRVLMLFLCADQTHNVYLCHAGQRGDNFCLRGYTRCLQIRIFFLANHLPYVWTLPPLQRVAF